MKILVWNGSPRKNGNTARLISAFAEGAGDAGHEVTVEQVAGRNIRGCLACEYCHDKQPGKCVQQDDMQELYRRLKEADMLVLASPIYYYTMTGQMISALNRTYALGRLTRIKKTALILCSASPNMYDAAIRQYQGVIGWWGAKDTGIFTIQGIEHSHALENTTDGQLEGLYRFGKSL